MGDESSQRGRFYEFAGAMCDFAYGFSSLFVGALTFALVLVSVAAISVGTVKCGISLYDSFHPHPKGDSAQEEDPVLLILHGMELLLLSPLPFLLINGLGRFVGQLRQPINPAKPEAMKEAHKTLSEAKILLYASFCGFIALDFLVNIVKTGSKTFDWNHCEMDLFGMIIFAIFFFCLKANAKIE